MYAHVCICTNKHFMHECVHACVMRIRIHEQAPARIHACIKRVPRQFVYRHFVYDTSSTDTSSNDISSTSVSVSITANQQRPLLIVSLKRAIYSQESSF